MSNKVNYSINTTTELSFQDTIDKTTDLLKEEGFGVLTEIDVSATLKKKLDYDFKPYRILGACNPTFARKAIEADHNIGVLLPCNVVIWDEGDHRAVAAMEPLIMSQISDDKTIQTVATEVSVRLRRVIEKLGNIPV